MMLTFQHWWSLNALRKKCLKAAPDGPLKDYLSVPFPSANTSLSELELLALDIETTGLNSQQHQLLSLGWVEVRNNIIDLGTCYHQVIDCPDSLVADNVAIHQITDQERRSGMPLAQAIPTLLNALKGKVMLAHYATIELEFLQQACLKLYGVAPVFPIIDTITLAQATFARKHIEYPPEILRLVNLRQHFNLPQHFAHNALNDAIATAELYIVLSHDQQQCSFSKLRRTPWQLYRSLPKPR